MEMCTMFIAMKIQHHKDFNSSKFIYKFHVTSIKISAVFFTGFEKFIPKLI